MAKRYTKWIFMILTLAVLVQSGLSPAMAAPEEDNAVVAQVHSLVPASADLVDEAIAILSKGWGRMTPAERALFNQLYDPGDTGRVDERYVAEVLDNYEKIGRRLDRSLTVIFEPDNDRCEGQRLYYTDLARIYVCPYFNLEDSTARKARVLIHEIAHMSLLAVDRPYFHKNTYSTRYRALTPRGSWLTEVPLLGPIFRELAHNDTLYHPDAYAWFAIEL